MLDESGATGYNIGVLSDRTYTTITCCCCCPEASWAPELTVVSR